MTRTALKVKIFLTWIATLFLVQAVAAQMPAETLEQWFQRSWEQSPEIKAAQAGVEAVEATTLGAKSYFYPTLSARYQFREFEISRQTKVFSLVAEQNIFNGFRDYYDRQEANRLLDAEKNVFQYRKLAVATTVANTLLKLASATAQKKIYDENSKLLDKRLSEFRRRTRIGRSRDVDLLQNQIDRLQLDRKRSTNVEEFATAAVTLNEYTGQSVQEAPFEMESILKQIYAFHQSMDKKPWQREELRLRVDAQAAAVRSANSTYWPSVGAVASYFPENDSKFSQNIDDWSFGVDMRWNFFEGFYSKALVNQERALQKVSEAQLARYNAGDEATRIRLKAEWDRLAAERKLIIQAEELSTRASRAQERDFRYGLITVLELSLSDEQNLSLKLERIKVAEQLGLILTESIVRGGVEGLTL